MLPITRATLQSFCRVCLRELPTNAALSKEPNHDINEDQLHKVLLSISGVTMKSSALSLYPQSICHACYVKTNTFWRFRDKAIVATGVLKILLSETLQESSLEQLKSYCLVCLRTGSGPFDKMYSTEKNGEPYELMCECTGLHLAVDDIARDSLNYDSRFPAYLCSRCYATLKNFKEFRAVSRQTEEYLRGILGGVPDESSLGMKNGGTNATILEEPGIVVEQLPIIDSIKTEAGYFGYERLEACLDFEMPIEVQLNNEIKEFEGVNLDELDIKKELEPDIDVSFMLKTEIIEPSVDDDISAFTTTNEDDNSSKTPKKKKVIKVKDEFEDWDSHSTESTSYSDDSDEDYGGKKQKNKNRIAIKNKRMKTKHTFTNAKKSYTPQTRSNAKFQSKQNADNENITKNEACATINYENKNTNETEDEDEDDEDTATAGKAFFHPKTNRTTFRCNKCNKNFYKDYLYEAHMKTVHQGIAKPFNCQYCEKSFRLIQLRNRHVNTRHGAELALTEDPFTTNTHICVFCQRPFKRKDHLNEHIRTVHEGLKPYECNICGKTFGSKNTKVRHERNHSEARPYACEYCGKRYNSETELKVHLQRHTTNPDLLCPHCKRGKSTIEELRKHIEMHEASRQHQCTKCGKIFSKLYHLREHDNAVHLKLRPYKCKQCDLTFGIRKTLMTHERRHDSLGRPENCVMCNLFFKNRRSLLLHVKRTHPEDLGSEEREELEKLKPKRQKKTEKNTSNDLGDSVDLTENPSVEEPAEIATDITFNDSL